LLKIRKLINECSLFGTILIFEKSNSSHLFYTGKYGDQISCKGEYCLPISYVVLENNEAAFCLKNLQESIDLLKKIYDEDKNFICN
jgi:hypothetical protein